MISLWLSQKSSIVSLAWILVLVATALATSVDSLRGWLAVSALACGPAAMLLHFANVVPLTMTETIQQGRR